MRPYPTPDVSHATATLLAHPTQNLLDPKATTAAIETRQKEIQRENEIAIDRVLNTALTKRGPVHLNLPFEEPLYNTTSTPLQLSHFSAISEEEENFSIKKYAERWHSSKKKMLLVGVLRPNSLAASLIEFLQQIRQ